MVFFETLSIVAGYLVAVLTILVVVLLAIARLGNRPGSPPGHSAGPQRSSFFGNFH
jgi:hypothetical protein